MERECERERGNRESGRERGETGVIERGVIESFFYVARKPPTL